MTAAETGWTSGGHFVCCYPQSSGVQLHLILQIVSEHVARGSACGNGHKSFSFPEPSGFFGHVVGET